MPNVVRQIVGPLDSLGPSFVGQVGIFVQSSNGKTVTITKAQILNKFNVSSGTTAQKMTTVRTWIGTQIETALGADMAPAALIAADFNSADGTPTALTVSS